MPHAALFVVQQTTEEESIHLIVVSMPHAALFVVQRRLHNKVLNRKLRFNAARSIVCGATPSLAALAPYGARKHFGKSSIFRGVFVPLEDVFA